MADKVLGFKISEELHDKVKTMIDNYAGGSNKEWLEKAVALAEMQSIKQGATEYNQDLTELETHTTRIYELISNMVQRSIYIKDHAVKEISDKLEQKESIIGEYQTKAKTALEELKQSQESLEALEQDKVEMAKQLEDQRSVNTNNQALIQEYKDKIDTLSTLVNQYKDYATENIELKESFATEKESLIADFQQRESRLQSSNDELKATVRDQQDQIEKLSQDNEALKVNQVNELTRLTQAKDLEKERAVLEVERNNQAKLQEIHDQYNEKLTRLYEKFESNNKDNNTEKQTNKNKNNKTGAN